MVIVETVTIGTTPFERHYSDAGVYIRQIETGELYEEAYDPAPCRYTYEETDKPLETAEEIPDADYAAAGKILLGEEA